jgi:heme exporter protein A
MAAPTQPPLAFSATDLACRRGERLVFAGLAFALPAGGALVLTGPNGSGKSSLLRLLAGLARPEAGAIRWQGADIAEDPGAHRERLHFIGHQDALKAVLTVGETLAFWAGMRGGAGVGPALAAFRLARLADWPCRLLSAGQRRRLTLARLVASPAALWLLDEPTAGLDADGRDLLREVLAEPGRTVIVSTHEPAWFEGLATSQVPIRAGRVAA